MNTISVSAIVSKLKDQFNVDMDKWQAVEHSATALKLSGLMILKHAVLVDIVKNFVVQLPAEVCDVEAVIQLSSIYPPGKVIISDVVQQPPAIFFVSDEPAVLATETDEFKLNAIPQLKGPYIDFIHEDGYIKVNEDEIYIAVLHNQLVLDEEGYPCIPEDAFDACLYYCLFVNMQPLYLLGKVQENVFTRVIQWKDQKIRQSQNLVGMKRLNQNQKDKALDIMTSFDRKRTGISA